MLKGMIMKKKLIFSILLLGLIISYLPTKAEDLQKCKTMFDGKCYEYYNTNNTDKKCKTMQNGICIEYFDISINNNNYTQEKTDMRELNKKEENQICSNRFGFYFVLDPYANVWSTWEVYNQSKIFITGVEPNSPALRAGLHVGDEILKINGTRAVKFKSYDDFDNYLDSYQSISLDIKSVNGDKKSVNLSKAHMCTIETREPFFESYWGQVCTYELDIMSKWISFVKRVGNKLTPQLNSGINEFQEEVNGWLYKRSQFRNGFNICLSNNYNKQDVNGCLMQLVNRTITTVSQEQNREMQRSNLQAQQEMSQQQVDAINNYSNALRNQHVKVDANIYHSGTINNNVNVNGTFNHYLY